MAGDPFDYFFDVIPRWAFFLLTVGLIAAALEGGFQAGSARRGCRGDERESFVTAIVSATLALLGFLLAMTFSIAVSRFDARRHAFLREVNALGTAYLRVDLLPEAQRMQARVRLKEYVDVRLRVVDEGLVSQGIKRSEELHRELWAIAMEASREAQNPVVVALFIQALNEVIDLHAERIVAAFQSRLPAAIWVTLYFVAAVGMAELGYQAALAGSARSPTVLGLILSFAAVLWLVASLDRAREGPLRISQQAMRDLQATMASGLRRTLP
jgi:hypothetical protein